MLKYHEHPATVSLKIEFFVRNVQSKNILFCPLNGRYNSTNIRYATAWN